MGYQSLNFNGNDILAYIDEPNDYQLKENDIIFVMPLNQFFQVTNDKKDTRKLRDEGFEKIYNTQLRNYGVLKFKSEFEEIYIERKSHLLLYKVKEENGKFIKI